jgi:hypothetical protein
VTRAVTSSLVWYRRVCNPYEWTRRAPRPCTGSQTAWWNTTSKRPSSTYERFVASHRRDWDERLPIFLLACRASTNNNTGFTSASLVFRREHHLPCELLFGTPLTRNYTQSITRRINEPSTRHTQLCAPTHEADKWPDENSLRQTGQLRGLPRGRQSVAPSANPYKVETAQAPNFMGGPVQGSRPDRKESSG